MTRWERFQQYLIMPNILPSKNRDTSSKRVRTEDELDQVAKRFAETWKTGDRVMTWLKEHEGKRGELSDLVFQGWLWADVGQALFRAGIAYRTGKPIDAITLSNKATRAREAVRARGVDGLRAPGRPRLGSISPPASPRPANRTNESATAIPGLHSPSHADSRANQEPSLQRPSSEARSGDDIPVGPQFRPVGLPGGRKLLPPQPLPQMKTPPVVVEATDDEIIERMLGKKRRT